MNNFESARASKQGREQDRQKRGGSALSTRMRSLVASSALSSAPKLATAALWATMIVTTAAAPAILADINQAQAEDLQGTLGVYISGYGSGNGNGYGGGSASKLGGVPGAGGGGGGGGGYSTAGIDGSNGKGGVGGTTTSGYGYGGKGGDVGATAIDGGITVIKGEDGRAGDDRGGGGGGGAGLFLGNGAAATHNGLIITGGNGGGAEGNYGGGGGAGAVVNGDLTNVQGGSIIGGKGGKASHSGAGGDGVAVVGVDSRFENFGTVTGGDGGILNSGGAGIRLGHDAYVVNAGIVTAGQSFGSDASKHTAAIEVVGDNSTLELRDDSVINGGVHVAAGVANATLATHVDTGRTMTLDVGAGPEFGGFDNMGKTGAGTLVLTGVSTGENPWRVSEGLLSISEAGNLGASAGKMTLDGGGIGFTAGLDLERDFVLETGGGLFDTQANTVTLSNNIDGAGGLTKAGTGTLVLTGVNTYKGGTVINAGMVQVGNGDLNGGIEGDVAINAGGTLEFNHLNREVFAGRLSGAGDLVINSPGSMVIDLTSDSSGFTGTTSANGTLVVDGALGSQAVNVSATGEVGGKGSIAGNVTIADGGVLTGRQGETLTIGQNLVLGQNSVIDALLGMADDLRSALFDVGGNLTLDGTLNVKDQGGFGPGLYRLFDYGGTLVDNTLEIGTLPDGVAAGDLNIVTGIAGQINLISTTGLVTSFWDGGNVASHNNGIINGGDGVWDNANTNWTDGTGALNGTWTPSEFAVFSGTGGHVTVDAGGVQASGMQFAVDGYTLDGGAIALDTAGADKPIIRVGDGTQAGAGMITTIGSQIQTTKGLEKTDLGTLVLTADNSYTGGTTITQGTLQLGNGGTTGSVTGDIVIGEDDAYDARLVVNHSNEVTLAQTLSGTGGLVQKGPGTVILTGEDTYLGGSTVEHGTLQLGNGGTDGSLKGDVDLVNTDSRFVVNLAKDITLDGTVLGKGGLEQAGSGTTTLTNEQMYTGETVISDGTLSLAGDGNIEHSERVIVNDGIFDIGGIDGDSSTIQSLKGNENGHVTGDGKTLIIADAHDKDDPTKEDVYAGIIEGDTRVEIGGGKERFTGENTYTGGTQIDRPGTLIIGDGGTKGSVQGLIENEGKLIYDRSDRYEVNPVEGGGDVSFAGGGNPVINTEQGITGEVIVKEGDNLSLEGDGDISNSSGATIDGELDVSGNNDDDVRIPHLRGEETGEVHLGDKNIVITDGDGSEFKGVVDGDGGGFTVENGKQILSGDNTYTGDTNIRETGELQLGNDDGRSGNVTSNVNNDGILSGNGSMKDLVNRGVVSPGTDKSFGSLTVNGNYVGDGGTLVLHQELGDDNSKGDRLVVQGNTSGSTDVLVINRGGLGAQTTNGIRVIEVGGQSDGAFNLNGDYVNYAGKQAVVAGAYAYTLEKGGVTNPDGNWYLRSRMKDNNDNNGGGGDHGGGDHGGNGGGGDTPEYQAGVPVYGSATNAVAALNRGGFASFGTRMKAGGGRAGSAGGGQSGNDKAGGSSSASGTQNDDGLFRSRFFWSRVQGGYSFYTPNGNATGSTYGSHDWTLQAGLDAQLMENDAGDLFASLWFDYTHSNIDVWSRVGNGKVKVNGYGVGAGLTWFAENGFYLDGQGKMTWYKSDMESDILSQSVATGVKSFGYALSLEAGKDFALNDRWTLTPQAQLIWSSLNTDDYEDAFAASVNTPTVQSLTGRIGFAASYGSSWQETDGTTTRLEVGGLANLYQELKSGSDYIMVSDIRVATGKLDKTWGEIGATANYSWADDTYSVFGKASLASSLQNFGDSYSVTGNVGFRVKW